MSAVLVMLSNRADYTYSTLVQREYPEGYEAFMELNGINHILIDIQSTKKVAIPDAVINSIMRIVLDRRNYPILVHCNHGKVCW